MPRDEQLELIDAHPRLGAPPGAVSALSFREQGYDHGDVGDLAAEFERLNAAYEAGSGSATASSSPAGRARRCSPGSRPR